MMIYLVYDLIDYESRDVVAVFSREDTAARICTNFTTIYRCPLNIACRARQYRPNE